MAIAIFIPEVWSARYQRHLDSSLVYAQPTVVNRNYEGEIQTAGDTVRIFKVSDPTVKTYTRNTDMDAPERPDGTEQQLVVDQEKYVRIGIDDVDERQALPVFGEYALRAARQMRQTIDAFVAARMSAAATANVVGTDASPISVKADGSGDMRPYQLAVELRRQLNSQEAPEDGRWMVINEDIEAEILNDDKFIPAGAAEQRTGQIGRIAGFDVLRTTAVPTSPGSGGSPAPNAKVLAGAGNYATSFANQLSKNETGRIPNQFGDEWRLLEVYGAKVIEPETLAQAHVAS
jgi:N4-gp56 family major capsid protein